MTEIRKFISLWMAVGLLLRLNLATIGWIMHRAKQLRTNRFQPNRAIRSPDFL